MPAVYERKQEWPSYEDMMDGSQPVAMSNYVSVEPKATDIEKQFREEEREDMMVEISEAAAREHQNAPHHHKWREISRDWYIEPHRVGRWEATIFDFAEN